MSVRGTILLLVALSAGCDAVDPIRPPPEVHLGDPPFEAIALYDDDPQSQWDLHDFFPRDATFDVDVVGTAATAFLADLQLNALVIRPVHPGEATARVLVVAPDGSRQSWRFVIRITSGCERPVAWSELLIPADEGRNWTYDYRLAESDSWGPFAKRWSTSGTSVWNVASRTCLAGRHTVTIAERIEARVVYEPYPEPWRDQTPDPVDQTRERTITMVVSRDSTSLSHYLNRLGPLPYGSVALPDGPLQIDRLITAGFGGSEYVRTTIQPGVGILELAHPVSHRNGGSNETLSLVR